jgi:hypothetical protein
VLGGLVSRGWRCVGTRVTSLCTGDDVGDGNGDEEGRQYAEHGTGGDFARAKGFLANTGDPGDLRMGEESPGAIGPSKLKLPRAFVDRIGIFPLTRLVEGGVKNSSSSKDSEDADDVGGGAGMYRRRDFVGIAGTAWTCGQSRRSFIAGAVSKDVLHNGTGSM